ncbi:CCA tRNA nucleotidyltransferase 1, mitochondrial isoform X1 [Fopius arisanus]|uniref:CCA tRNA nucleotidyltransferase 1, mitochondrial isoform X1 n=2 Tax=Fopius arisanus TaxID=64838 RepID=A0A9R1U4B7_9HYME|nr:PREDICTED: CCA tRNA nucleotidyltransferase 1, mitochondrial isoform X1 [Fopius arisanus]
MIIIPLFVRHLKSISRLHVRYLNENTKDLKWRRIRDFEAKMPTSRIDPVITKLESPEFKSIFTPELELLQSVFKKYNHELRIAGGAVRDLLTGKIPKDIDFATTATPDEMKEMFNREEIRMLNLKGEKHGTVTARINDKENFEVTTLRIDVVTDGRHADIEFTTDWKLDANRRDLTINSMFMDFEGRVYDYFFGYDDLKKRRVAFVGDAGTRICEDFLRILRYFRFYGRISEHPNSHEESIITAIKQNVEGLERISGERIWSEWNKILDGNFGVELTKKMVECGVGKYIGLPEAPDLVNFERICQSAKIQRLKLHPVTMIASMLRNEQEALNIHSRLHWSAYNRDLALFLVIHREDKISVNPLHPYQYIVLNSSGKIKDIREYIVEVLKYKGTPELAEQFEKWIPPKFPVNGNDLKELVTHRRLIGQAIMRLKKIWLDGDFKIPKEELLKRLPEVLEEINEVWNQEKKKEVVSDSK